MKWKFCKKKNSDYGLENKVVVVEWYRSDEIIEQSQSEFSMSLFKFSQPDVSQKWKIPNCSVLSCKWRWKTNFRTLDSHKTLVNSYRTQKLTCDKQKNLPVVSTNRSSIPPKS